jgi:hypothetical protein
VDFDDQRRELIEAVLEPLGGGAEMRGAVELAVAIGSQEDFGKAGERGVRQAAERMRKIAGFFRWRAVFTTSIIMLAALAGLWLAVAGRGKI